MTFRGRVALVTGGASGMGRVAVRRLIDAGAIVAAWDVNEAGLAETAGGSEKIVPMKVDISDSEAVRQGVDRVEHQIGPIDRVYNAAALMPFGMLLEQEVDQIHRLMAINYGGLVNIAKATLPRMLERRRGDFISFGSIAAWMPTLYTGAYTATKFAVAAFSEVLYHENRDRGVRFVCVCPPVVDTPLLQQARDTVWPKIMTGEKPVSPEMVIDCIEDALEAGRFWVFPGGAKRAWYARRFIPEQVWKQVHKAEGF